MTPHPLTLPHPGAAPPLHLAQAIADRWAALMEWADDAAARMVAALNAIARRFQQMMTELVEAANTPAGVAGVEGRMYVRAALSPAYATPAALSSLVSAITTGDLPDTFLLTAENRARVAAAAVTGWSQHRDGDAPEVLAWHRVVGGTTLAVSRG